MKFNSIFFSNKNFAIICICDFIFPANIYAQYYEKTIKICITVVYLTLTSFNALKIGLSFSCMLGHIKMGKWNRPSCIQYSLNLSIKIFSSTLKTEDFCLILHFTSFQEIKCISQKHWYFPKIVPIYLRNWPNYENLWYGNGDTDLITTIWHC